MADSAAHTTEENQMMCMKYKKYMAQSEMACRDPQVHCKFRPACPIWFITRKGGKDIDRDVGTKVDAA